MDKGMRLKIFCVTAMLFLGWSTYTQSQEIGKGGWEQDMQKLETRIEKQLEEVSENKAMLDKMSSALTEETKKSLDKLNKTLQSELAESQSANVALQKELHFLMQERARLNEELTELTRGYSSAKNKVSSFKEEVSSLVKFQPHYLCFRLNHLVEWRVVTSLFSFELASLFFLE